MAGQADRALVDALTTPEQPGPLLDLDDLAERTGMSTVLLEALEREGFLLPRPSPDAKRYTAADADALRAGLALLESGVPLGELLDLARRSTEAMNAVADDAVDVFIRFVRDPIQGSADSDAEATEQLLAAFHDMLPATSRLVAHHFQRLVIARALARLDVDDAGDEDGTASEHAADRS